VTWIVGMPTPFGAAIAVSDVRVTWGDGSSTDCLRKIHPVHRNMACGFAGSVELGFKLIEDFRKSLSAIPEGNAPLPAVMTWRWWRRARRIFAEAPESARHLGCSLMILGVSPQPGVPWPRSYVATLRAPEFRPEFIGGIGRCASIGSGDGEAEYRRAIEGQNLILLQGAVGHDRPGIGIAQFLASRLNLTVRGHPAIGVSEHLQVTGIDLLGTWSGSLRLGEFGEDGPVYPVVPTIASTYEEFRAIARQRGSEAEAAIAVALKSTSSPPRHPSEGPPNCARRQPRVSHHAPQIAVPAHLGQDPVLDSRFLRRCPERVLRPFVGAHLDADLAAGRVPGPPNGGAAPLPALVLGFRIPE